jgi:signal transduction histidine kinase/CheY-like chemotaxis protein
VEAVAALSAGASGARGEAVRALFQQTPTTLAGHAVGIVLMGAMYAQTPARERLLAWLAAVLLLWLLRLAHFLRYRNRRHALDDATLLAWQGSWRVLALAQGSMWGIAAWIFWGQGERFHDTALILIVYSYALAAVQLLSAQPAVFMAFSSVVLLPLIARVAADTSEPYHWQLAGLLAVLLGITWMMSRTYRDALSKTRFHKQRSDELAVQLRHEKAAADAARRSAEAANRAKTQFFAAASHDLRQPLHALGLFAETLRQRAHDPEVAALVNSINESVDALEGLFGELLDITRIDTGGVEVAPQAVRLKELFARLKLHFEPTAFEKGLALTLRGASHVAHCDPVILERILRNLVSNAIRYTEDGGVLVSARVRRHGGGETLLIQVWDSGIGIPEASLPRIFDEFYQVQHNQPLQAHHRKGLGLGLAIVQRLAALAGAPLSVRSRVGHGTVFSFVVPVGVAPAVEAAPTSARAPIGLTLEGRRIAVVEDEAAVRDGLEVLLKAWGADVVAFETVDDARAWAQQAGDDSRPHLLIVDYRLPAGTTGLEALAVLRARWPDTKLPAIVVTGSTIGGHEDEAAAHDFHLLIKPVLPNKLRAMIAFKLGQRGTA